MASGTNKIVIIILTFISSIVVVVGGYSFSSWVYEHLLEQQVPGELRYAIDAELRGIGLVRYGTEFMPEGKVLIRHLKQQQYLENHQVI